MPPNRAVKAGKVKPVKAWGIVCRGKLLPETVDVDRAECWRKMSRLLDYSMLLGHGADRVSVTISLTHKERR